MMFWHKFLFFVLKKVRSVPKNTGTNDRILSVLPSPDDIRDDAYAVSISKDEVLPQIASIDQYSPPIKNQGSIGSCASHAACTAMEILMRMRDPHYVVELSELYHYYTVRSPEYMNTLPADSGQYMRDGLKVCRNKGVSPEKLWPYDVNKYNKKPDVFAQSFSKYFKINQYSRCYDIQAIKRAIYGDMPVCLGLWVTDSVFKTNSKGDVLLTGKKIGGHEVLIVGYDDNYVNPDKSLGCFHIINSWGVTWGNKGKGRIGYGVVKKNLMEAWAVR